MPAGYLEIIMGPMFSGKTTKLTQIYKSFTAIGKQVVVINYSDDKRYSDTMLSTHDQTKIPCIFGKSLSEVRTLAEVGAADIILINEAQFFPDLFDIVLELVEQYGKSVYLYGLDGDFERGKFGSILDLIPYCDRVEKLCSLCHICRNGEKALFSHRISNEMDQVVIGSDNYIPLCRNCYLSRKS